MIYCLRGPLKESYQADLDSLNPLVVAVPCLLMAFIARPTTRHMFLFRVSAGLGGEGREGGAHLLPWEEGPGGPAV